MHWTGKSLATLMNSIAEYSLPTVDGKKEEKKKATK